MGSASGDCLYDGCTLAVPEDRRLALIVSILSPMSIFIPSLKLEVDQKVDSAQDAAVLS